MAGVEIIPKSEIRTGDRVCLLGERRSYENARVVTKLEGETGVLVQEGDRVRFVRFEDIDVALRPMLGGR